MNESELIRILGVLIGIIGAFIAGYPSFKPQFTKGRGEGADLGKLPLDGGRPDPDVKNRERIMRKVGFVIITCGSLLVLFSSIF